LMKRYGLPWGWNARDPLAVTFKPTLRCAVPAG
jgi:hypothetical protein